MKTPNTVNGFQNNSSFSEAFSTKIQAAGVEPVMKPTRPTERDEDKAAILEQRKSAVDFWSTAKSGTLKKNKTQLALFDPPPLKSNRMSQMGTLGRGVMIKKIEEAASPNSKAIKAREGAGGLIKRLRDLGMASIEMQGDGNCQFRALADQLFGSQEHHAFVRALAIAHMQAQSDFFSIYFEDEREWNEYIRGMARSRTWGDELTLRACVEAFGCIAHVITSESANWYLVYTPESTPDETALAQACARKRLAAPKAKKEVFVSYISPIHYNAIAALTAAV